MLHFKGPFDLMTQFLDHPFPNRPVFLCVCTANLLKIMGKSFENTVGKGEIARHEQFLFFHSVFYPFGELSTILTLYHEIPTFKEPQKEGLLKTLWNKRAMMALDCSPD